MDMKTKIDFLIERVQKQNSSANVEKIRAAYECAAAAHEGQKRKNGDPYITITAVGKNEHGTRRATVLFVLNYGRAKGYGQITGTYFWTKGVRNAQKRVNAELEKILTQKLKERGLL